MQTAYTGVSTLFCVIFLSSLITDGGSLLKLKDEGKRVGEAWIKSLPMIDYPYAMGVHHDIFSNEWSVGKTLSSYSALQSRKPHPAHFTTLFDCEHRSRGILIKYATTTALLVAIVSVLLTLNGTRRVFGVRIIEFHFLVLQFLLTSLLLISLIGFGSLYHEELTCYQYPSSVDGIGSIPLRYRRMFNQGYGVTLLVICTIIGFGNITLLLCLSHSPKSDFNFPEPDLEPRPVVRKTNYDIRKDVHNFERGKTAV